MRRLDLLLVVLVAAAGCGGSGGGGGGGGGGGSPVSFSISGAPHSGTYALCTVMPNGANALVSCQGLPGCDTCTFGLTVPAGGGPGHCSDGTATVSIVNDPDIGTVGELAAAGCDGATAMPPACPTDAYGCNQVVGTCDAMSDPPMFGTASDPSGHFSGTVSAMLWSDEQRVACDNNGHLKSVPMGSSFTIDAGGSF